MTEEPKTPKFERNISGTLRAVQRGKLAPAVLPFESNTNKDTKSKIEAKAIVRLKKTDFDTRTDIEKRPLVNPKKLEESLEKGPEKKAKETEKPHEKPIKEAVAAPPAPVVRSPSRSPSPSPVRTLSPHSTPPSSAPSIPLSPVLVGPVVMGTVEEIKNALVESNRVAAMPIPQFYGKKGEKPEDHIMKVEDYVQNYNIRDQEQKCNRFKDTCCGKART